MYSVKSQALLVAKGLGLPVLISTCLKRGGTLYVSLRIRKVGCFCEQLVILVRTCTKPVTIMGYHFKA